jgi:hypothetical protein
MKLLLSALLALTLSTYAEEKVAQKVPATEKAPKEKAEKADKYQVTGPILEVTDTKLVVEGRGKERHEFARTADTKVDGGELKVGTKVTVKYTMTAASVEVKAAK